MILKSRFLLDNNNEDYKKVFQHYEKCYEREGDNHKGLDWPNEKDLQTRFQVMSELFEREANPVVLDFGCGLGHYLDFIKMHNSLSHRVQYLGLDISEKFISQCRKKFPSQRFYCIDLLKEDLNIDFDYAILNGVFTVKGDLEYSKMWSFMTELLQRVYVKSSKGIAFNVMSKNVDWEKENLFHVSLDLLTDFVCKKLNRNFIIRNDYGLYEYTCYVYKNPRSNT